MELKHGYPSCNACSKVLLIVPYGIETRNRISCNRYTRLLIVPYGIETIEIPFTKNSFTALLIVPYGIETADGLH